MTANISLESFSARPGNLGAAAMVYAKTWNRDLHLALQFISSCSNYTDFHGLVALADQQIVGMGFGNRALPGQWWYDQVKARVGVNHPALQDVWMLTELAVLLPYRRLGVGGQIHDALLALQPCPRTILSTQVDNTGAQRFYLARGWQHLHPGFVFVPGDPPYTIMGREGAPAQQFR